MAEFTASPIVSAGSDPNAYFNAQQNSLAALGAQQTLAQQAQMNPIVVQGAQQDLLSKQLANQYTQAIQPAKLGAFQSQMAALGVGSGAAGQGQPTPQSQPSGLGFTGALPQSADVQTQAAVGQEAQRAGVDPDWAQRIQYAESGSYPNAATAKSPVGAIGGMQLMPATAQTLGVDPTNPADNIRGGVAYLKQLQGQFGNPVLATAAYNAGPQRVHDFLSGKSPLPAETVNYVGKVFGNGDGAAMLNSAIGQGGMTPAPIDDAARQSVKQLLMLRASAMVDPQGMRAIPGIQSALDNIAGPGGIVSNTGDVLRVPGAYATRYTAAQAAKAGETVPLQQQAANKAGIDMATHAANSDVDTSAAFQRPTTLSPNQVLTTPAQAIPGAAPPGVAPPQPVAPDAPQQTAPASQPASPNTAPVPQSGTPAMTRQQAIQQATNELGPSLNTMPPEAANAAVVARAQQLMNGGGQPTAPAQQAAATQPTPQAAPPPAAPATSYQAPVDTANLAAGKDVDYLNGLQQPILDQARESQNALNRIGQIRSAMSQATANGIPPGYFSPELAQAAAAAKSMGIDLSTLGIKPAAVQNEQVAREALTQINGEILKRMFPQRITNADVATFGANLANYGMDPAALDPILNQAEQAARYDVGKADNLLSYKAKNGGNLRGWDTQFYPSAGYGPNLFDAVKSGTVPSSGGAPTQSSAPQAGYSVNNPAKPQTRADAMALQPGTPFINPATGRVMIKH